jgi:predicted protein tyrosine phosphatase
MSVELQLSDIYILSQEHAIKFYCDRPWACISITTQNGDHPVLDDANCIDILQVAFADLEDKPSPVTLQIYPELGKLIDGTIADQILDFVETIAGRIEVLMVHCAQGQSRSPATTAALLGIKPKLLEGTAPNRLVTSMLEWRKRERPERKRLLLADSLRIFGTELTPFTTSFSDENGVERKVVQQPF